MTSKPCRDCKRHITIDSLDRCKRVSMTDADGNPCFGPCAFQRADIGIHGMPHCGVEGKYWEAMDGF
jgi:hypothetical protein